MRYKLILAVISTFIFTSACLADTSLKAEVDKTKLSADDTLTYKLTITSDEKSLNRPQMPKFTGFNVVSQAESSSLIFEKPATRTHLVYVYILAPAGTGKLKIDPSQINLNGKNYQTESFEIEVTQGTSKPIPPSQEEAPKTTL